MSGPTSHARSGRIQPAQIHGDAIVLPAQLRAAGEHNKAVTADACRRPIAVEEQPSLLDLGDCLRGLRTHVGLSQALLANRAELNERSYRRIEHGHRRTRASTLRRIADGLVAYTTTLGTADAVTALLVQAAGASLADESEYRSRVEARRRRRMTKTNRRPVTEHVIERAVLSSGEVIERHRHTRWVTRHAVRVREYEVVPRHPR